VARSERVYIRMTAEDKNKFKELAAVYGMEGALSEFFRVVLSHIDEKRPALTVKISPRQRVE